MAVFSNAIVIGASSGMGAELARLMARKRVRTALVARRKEALEQLASRIAKETPKAPEPLVYPHDVREFGEVPALFQRITHDLGGLDLIVYCAGVMPPVAVNEYDFEKDRMVYEVNVLGAIAWLNEAAKRFENQESGVLAALSSVAGERGRKGQPVYSSSKAALNSYMEGLRNRLGHRGVRVVTIKPGPVRTPMTEALSMPFMIDADEAARQIWAGLRSSRTSVYVPKKWRAIMWVIRNIPSMLFRGRDI